MKYNDNRKQNIILLKKIKDESNHYIYMKPIHIQTPVAIFKNGKFIIKDDKRSFVYEEYLKSIEENILDEILKNKEKLGFKKDILDDQIKKFYSPIKLEIKDEIIEEDTEYILILCISKVIITSKSIYAEAFILNKQIIFSSNLMINSEDESNGESNDDELEILKDELDDCFI